MNKKIVLLFISLLILCSGCTAEYTLTVQEDFSIKESFTAMEDADFYNKYGNSSVQKVIGFILEPNLDYLNSNNYQVEQIIHDTEAGVRVENTYKSIEEFKEKSKVPNQLASDWSYVDNGDSITLSMKGTLNQDEQDQDGRYVIDELKLQMIIPFEVLEHNADSTKDNTYIWKLDADNNGKEISITFNKNKIVDKGEEPPYIIFGIIIVLVLIVGIAIYSIITSNKNRNDLDD